MATASAAAAAAGAAAVARRLQLLDSELERRRDCVSTTSAAAELLDLRVVNRCEQHYNYPTCEFIQFVLFLHLLYFDYAALKK